MSVISGVRKDMLATIDRMGISDKKLQMIMESGMFHDFLRIELGRVNRAAFRRMMGIEDRYQYEIDYSRSVVDLMEEMRIENCTEVDINPNTFPVVKEQEVWRTAEMIHPDVAPNIANEEDLFVLYRLRQLKPANLFEVLSFFKHNKIHICYGGCIGAFDETMYDLQGDEKLWYMLLVAKLRKVGSYALYKQYVGNFRDGSTSLLGITKF